MSKPPDNIVKLSKTLTLGEYTNPRNSNFGFWLHDDTRGMNLAMRAKTPESAFVEALTYYQYRLLEVEQGYKALQTKVDAFVAQFVEDEDAWG